MVTASVTAPTADYAVQHPLRERNFRLLFTGSTVSMLGDQFYLVALPWLVLQQTGSAVAMGAIMMAGAIPRTVLMLMGGAVSDRISPRRIMMMAAGARLILVAVLGFLLWLGLLHTWQLYVLAAAFGTADAFDAPAADAFMPFLVKQEQLVNASSVSQIRTQIVTMVGPMPAGFIIKALGLAWAFLIDAASFLFVIAALLRLPDPVPVQIEKKPLRHSIMEGLQYVGKDVPLRTLMLAAIGMNFCLSGPISLGLAYLAKTKFGSPAFLGIMLSSVAAGGLCGALLAGIWKIRRRGIMILGVSFVLALLLGSLAMLDGRWTIPVVLFLMGVSAGIANVQIGAWIMERIDAAVRGRVSSLLTLGEMGTIPISLALAGLLSAVNLKLMFALAGSVMLLVTIAAAMQKTIRQIQ
jgi:MFS family permease